MFCNKCGNKLEEQAKFCPRCGNPVKPLPVSGVPVSPSVPADKPTMDFSDKTGEEGNRRKGIMILLSVIMMIGILAAGTYLLYSFGVLDRFLGGKDETSQIVIEEAEEIIGEEEDITEKAEDIAEEAGDTAEESYEDEKTDASGDRESETDMTETDLSEGEPQPVVVNGTVLSGLPMTRYAYTFEDRLDGAARVERSGDSEEGYNKGFIPAVTAEEAVYGSGVDGKAVYLDGSYGLVLDNVSPLGKVYTIAFWVKAGEYSNYTPLMEVVSDFMSTTGESEWVVMNKKQDDAGNDIFPVIWSCREAEDSWLEFHPWYDETASACLGLNEWHHMALVVDGNRSGDTVNFVECMLFVDGEKVSSGEAAGTAFAKEDSRVYFGINCWDRIFRGSIDELKLWDCALTQQQIRQLYGAYQGM